MASLGFFVVLGWIAIPYLGTGYLLPVVGLTALYLWLKMIETIVAIRGNLPNIYHCYYKSLNWCKSKRLAANETVPEINSEAAEVLFSLKAMHEYETEIQPELVKFEFDERTRAELDAQTRHTRTAYDPETDSERKDEGVNLRRRMGSPERDQAEPSESTPLTAVEAKKSAIREKVQSLVHIAKTSLLPMQPAFIIVPCFNMDLSILSYNYFPFKALRARLAATDVTFLTSAQRGLGYNFETSITSARVNDAARRHIDVTITSTIHVMVPVDESELPEDFLEAKRREERELAAGAQKGKTSVRTKMPKKAVPYAIVSNTYRFTNAAPSAVPADGIVGPAGSALHQELLKRAAVATVSSGESVADQSTPISPVAIQNFALACGNIHPRHIAHPLASMFRSSEDSDGRAGTAQLDLNYIVRSVIGFATSHYQGDDKHIDPVTHELNYPFRLVLSAVDSTGNLNAGCIEAGSDVTVCLSKLTDVDDKGELVKIQDASRQTDEKTAQELEARVDQVRTKIQELEGKDGEDYQELLEEATRLLRAIVPKGHRISNRILPRQQQKVQVNTGNRTFATGLLFLTAKDS